MKKQTVNGYSCTATYRSLKCEDGGYRCVLKCVSDGTTWDGIGSTRPSAKVAAVRYMRDCLAAGY